MTGMNVKHTGRDKCDRRNKHTSKMRPRSNVKGAARTDTPWSNETGNTPQGKHKRENNTSAESTSVRRSYSGKILGTPRTETDNINCDESDTSMTTELLSNTATKGNTNVSNLFDWENADNKNANGIHADDNEIMSQTEAKWEGSTEVKSFEPAQVTPGRLKKDNNTEDAPRLGNMSVLINILTSPDTKTVVLM